MTQDRSFGDIKTKQESNTSSLRSRDFLHPRRWATQRRNKRQSAPYTQKDKTKEERKKERKKEKNEIELDQ